MSIFSRFIDWIFSFFWKEEMEVTLIGLNNSGKTTFANLISNGNYSEEMTPTIGFSLRRVTKGSVSIKIFDIGGQARFRSMWARYCRGVDVIVFMLDAATEKSIEKSGEELLSLLNDSHLTGIPMLILGNKNDLPDALDERELVETLNLCSVQNREIGCISISCKNKENIGTSLQWIVNHRRSRL